MKEAKKNKISLYQEQPYNYLPWAIIAAIFGFFPTGIWAVIKCCEVKSNWNKGLRASALESAASAKKWTFISLAIGLVSILALFVGGNAWLYVQLLAIAYCLLYVVYTLIAYNVLFGASPIIEQLFNFVIIAIIIATAIGLYNLCF